MDKETADKMRGMIRRVTLKNTDDGGETQRTSIETAEGIWHEDVEVLQPYGFAGHTPENGALGLMIALGGDQGDVVVLPVGNPSKRMGDLPAGAAGVYNEHGDSILVLPDGTISVKAAGSVVFSVGGVTMTLSAGGLAIEGGEVTHNSRNIGHDHKHTDVTPGAGLSGEPEP